MAAHSCIPARKSSDRGFYWAPVHGVTKSPGGDLVTEHAYGNRNVYSSCRMLIKIKRCESKSSGRCISTEYTSLCTSQVLKLLLIKMGHVLIIIKDDFD